MKTTFALVILYLILSQNTICCFKLKKDPKNFSHKPFKTKLAAVQKKSELKYRSRVDPLTIIEFTNLAVVMLTKVIEIADKLVKEKIKGLIENNLNKLVNFLLNTNGIKTNYCQSFKSANDGYTEVFAFFRLTNLYHRQGKLLIFHSNCQPGKLKDTPLNCNFLKNSILHHDTQEEGYALKTFMMLQMEDKICDISSDRVGELTYFRGRTNGLIAGMSPKETKSDQILEVGFKSASYLGSIVGTLEIAAVRLENLYGAALEESEKQKEASEGNHEEGNNHGSNEGNQENHNEGEKSEQTNDEVRGNEEINKDDKVTSKEEKETEKEELENVNRVNADLKENIKDSIGLLDPNEEAPEAYRKKEFSFELAEAVHDVPFAIYEDYEFIKKNWKEFKEAENWYVKAHILVKTLVRVVRWVFLVLNLITLILTHEP